MSYQQGACSFELRSSGMLDKDKNLFPCEHWSLLPWAANVQLAAAEDYH